MCDCNGISKDQTKSAVFDFLESKGLDALDSDTTGFGLFQVPAPENGILEYKTIYVDSLSYKEAVKRGANCKAFQWVPTGIPVTLASGRSLTVQSISDIELVTQDCTSSRCKQSGCPMGCFCYSNEVGNCHR